MEKVIIFMDDETISPEELISIEELIAEDEALEGLKGYVNEPSNQRI